MLRIGLDQGGKHGASSSQAQLRVAVDSRVLRASTCSRRRVSRSSVAVNRVGRRRRGRDETLAPVPVVPEGEAQRPVAYSSIGTYSFCISNELRVVAAAHVVLLFSPLLTGPQELYNEQQVGIPTDHSYKPFTKP